MEKTYIDLNREQIRKTLSVIEKSLAQTLHGVVSDKTIQNLRFIAVNDLSEFTTLVESTELEQEHIASLLSLSFVWGLQNEIDSSRFVPFGNTPFDNTIKAYGAFVFGIMTGLAANTETKEQIKSMLPAFEHGNKFRAGKGRNDSLGAVLENIVASHISTHTNHPQWPEVVVQLKRMAENKNPSHPVIQDVDMEEETVYWLTLRGGENQTNFKQIRERLTGIRKKIPVT